MSKTLIIVGLVLAALFPLLLLVVNRSFYAKRLVSRIGESLEKKLSNKFSVASEIEGYTITLVDTAYLEWVAENKKIFTPNAIVDPRVYQGFPDLNLKYSISKVKFVFLEELDRPMSIIVEGDGRDSPLVILGKGDFSVEGDTLVIRVSLNLSQINDESISGKFSFEDAFLRTAVSTMYYSVGLLDPLSENKALLEVKQNILDYLYGGIFSWPFRIEK
jgi:hypothetical protein